MSEKKHDRFDYIESMIQQSFSGGARNALRRQILSLLLQKGGIPTGGEPEAETVASWIVIDSLSRLRSEVGGRFDNIKRKWLGAGFPLREHRGDRDKEYEVDEEGWERMVHWLLKHNFEARLTPDVPDCFFEIRAVAQEDE